MEALRCWPLIERELRTQSRLVRGHWLRVAGVFALLLATYGALVIRLQNPIQFLAGTNGFLVEVPATANWLERWSLAFSGYEQNGSELLATMNAILLIAIWIVVPFLTADCVSTERRNGTLGLLLLTPMRGIDVAVSKLIVNGWQAAGIALAGLPLLMLPILAGGLTWMDALHVALTSFAVLNLALSAGMVASAFWDGPRAVLIAAAAVAVGFGLILSTVWAITFAIAQISSATPAGSLTSFPSYAWDDFESTWSNARLVIFDPVTALSLIGRTTVAGAWRLLQPAAGFSLSLVVAGSAVAIVGHHLRVSTQEGRARTLPSAANPHPATEGRLLQFRVQVLEGIRTRSPLLWAELRTWRGHVIPWLSVILVFPWEAARTSPTAGWDFQSLVAGPLWALSCIVALAATSCLFSERSSGALELLLTVPDGPRCLLSGKFLGLALQVLPALILVLGIENSMALRVWDENRSLSDSILFSVGLSLIILGRIALAASAGAFFGLHLRSLVSACFTTMLGLNLASRLIPIDLLANVGTNGSYVAAHTIAAAAGILDLALAALLYGWTRRTLQRRAPTIH